MATSTDAALLLQQPNLWKPNLFMAAVLERPEHLNTPRSMVRLAADAVVVIHSCNSQAVILGHSLAWQD
jgi:hypothetical protein